MRIEQFVAESLGDSSYLLVSGRSAAAVDPQRDVRPFLAAAERLGAGIDFVLETHVHNDYLSGGRELAERGAKVVAPTMAKLQFPHLPLDDGGEIEIGGARLRALAAPGHTYEHHAYLAIGEDGETAGAFTGGAMLMAAAGRSDLLGPDHTEELTRMQWDTAQRLVHLLSPAAEILPTHGAGSFCSAAQVAGERRAPLAVEGTRNPLLTAGSFEAFRAIHLADPAPIPGYYQYMAPINRRGPRVYGEPPRPRALDLDELEPMTRDGVYAVDVRSRFDYIRGHVPGSVLVESGSSMLAYFGWLLPFNAPLALIAADAAQAGQVTVDLFRIGYEDVRGCIAYPAWEAEGRPAATLEAVGVDGALAILREGKMQVLDVRFEHELASQPLPGARGRPIERLPEWLESIERRPTLVTCESGYRATAAASFLQKHGHDVVALVDGGAPELLARMGRDAR
jgi:hydroxyacylglutathione hydrolase